MVNEAVGEVVAVDELFESDKTTIPCKKVTRIRFKDFGKKGESYDHLMNRTLDELEKLREENKELYKLKGELNVVR